MKCFELFSLLSQMLSVTETETMAAYMKPPSRYGGGGGGGGGEDSSAGPAKGFVVRDAPWNAPGNKVGAATRRQSSAKSRLASEPLQQAHRVVCVVSCLSQAPDMSSAEDFPTFGAGVAPKQTSAWGPKKF